MTYTSVMTPKTNGTDMYIYTTPKGFKIHVVIVEDCGMVKDSQGLEWHKVVCRPIGLNNTIPMTLNLGSLVRV